MRKDDLEVVALERGHYTSYSACGIPYWVGGEVDGDHLVARTPEQHRANGIDLRMRIEVESLDLDTQTIKTRNVDTGTTDEEAFDDLVIATGAEPVRPDLPGIDATGIFGVQTLDDGGAVIKYLNDRNPKRVVVVGSGYIGIEMAEAMANRGLSVTVVDQATEPMTTLDPDMGRLVHEAMEGMGIDVRTESQVDGFAAAADGHVETVSVNGTELPADIVICGLGVKPNTALAKAAGLTLGSKGDFVRTCGCALKESTTYGPAETAWKAGISSVKIGCTHHSAHTRTNRDASLAPTWVADTPHSPELSAPPCPRS
jgi:NADPH-dependent 2,4-dienoyl-CoA reductase/sulfur reductase-like enzyme